MASYIVLEAPGGPDSNHSNTKFIADKFSWSALILPWLWLASNRLWLFAIAVLVLQIVLAQLASNSGFAAFGTLAPFAIALIVALEGRNILIRQLIAKGWSMKASISADNVDTAEQIYYSLYAANEKPLSQSKPSVDWSNKGPVSPNQTLDDPMGIFQFDVKGRR